LKQWQGLRLQLFLLLPYCAATVQQHHQLNHPQQQQEDQAPQPLQHLAGMMMVAVQQQWPGCRPPWWQR
jgi:hypothetical protein